MTCHPTCWSIAPRTPGFSEQVEQHLAALDKDDSPTAYLFRCRHCGQHLAYSDSA